jgi:hypothetical protein
MLRSWGLPFGTAVSALAPGDYPANERVLAALRGRGLGSQLPAAPNFVDDIPLHTLPEGGEAAWLATGAQAEQVPLVVDADAQTFAGVARPGGRGVAGNFHGEESPGFTK